MLEYSGTPLTFNGSYLTLGSSTPPSTPSDAILQWSDEFTGSGVSFATDSGGGSWRTRGIEGGPSATVPPSVTTGYVDYAGSSWNISPVQHPNNSPFSVANSILTITVNRNPGLTNVGGATWLGGLLVSNYLNNLSWKYGYFEWRMKIPNPVRGMFPALWLFANDPNRATAYSGAEIDMFEVFGHITGSPSSCGWHENPSGIINGGPGEQAITDITQWHRYGVSWTATSIVYYLDGVQYYSVDSSVPAWFNNVSNMGIRINYAMDPTFVSSSSGQLSTSTDPAIGVQPTMMVDYVRVYDRLPNSLATGTDDPGIQ